MKKFEINFILYFIFLALICGCNEKTDTNQVSTEGISQDIEKNSSEFMTGLNSVKGHFEQTSITGNFTGLGIDTLHVIKEIDLSFVKQENENPDHLSPAYLSKYTQFFVTSNNPIFPKFEIYGNFLQPPKLVYEGDLDSDGKDEWGYLVPGENSQWRQYNVFNYDLKNKKWRYLYKDSNPDEFLSTRQSIRESGKEIVEKGKKKGEIKINYTDYHDIFRDTLVQANYLPFE